MTLRAFYLLSVWLHIVVAAIWVGGMVFLALVLVPAIRRPEYQHLAAGLVRWTGTRFRTVGWVCLGLLVLTGGINLAVRGVRWGDLWSAPFWQGSFGRALGIKLLLVAMILMMSAWHDFVIGPQAAAALQGDPASPEATGSRSRARWFGRLNLGLSLLVVALGVMLVRGGF